MADRIGETSVNTHGSKMTIIEYNNNRDITVKFDNGYSKITNYINFRNGKVKNPYDRTVFSVGYMGDGDYKAVTNHKKTPQYNTWSNMMKLCYGKYNSYYKDCEVCEDWHNFQIFAKWFDENYYAIQGEKIELDKDLLVKRNSTYSPITCVFLPKRINSIVLTRKAKRGDYPLGVTKTEKTNAKFVAYINDKNGKSIALGSFSTEKEAFEAYKKAKEAVIKEIAAVYKDKIPEKAYKALMAYIVEIND